MFMLMAKDDTDLAGKIAGELEGSALIMAAVTAFPDDAALQGRAFEALWQIALNQDTRDAMVVGNIIPAICKACRKHRYDRNVQEYGSRLMWALMVDQTNNQKAINQEG